MNELLTKVLDAHGGLERWRSYNKVEATIVSGGGFFALKGVLPDANPRRMAVWLHEERSSVTPYGAPDQRTMFMPDRITIEKLDGEALWTYLTTPFAFAMDGFRVEETAPWQEGKKTWRVMRVYFPGSIGTHCQVQDFFFDEKFELRRHDYSVNIAGGFPAAQLMLEYTEANGMRLPSKRRAYTRGPDRRPILDMLMVSIDISDVAFS